jgi:hypothetical protein
MTLAGRGVRGPTSIWWVLGRSPGNAAVMFARCSLVRRGSSRHRPAAIGTKTRRNPRSVTRKSTADQRPTPIGTPETGLINRSRRVRLPPSLRSSLVSVVQRTAHLVADQEAAGSNPAGDTAPGSPQSPAMAAVV